MQKIFFISCLALVAFAGFSQTPTFTFECFCGTLTPADTTCDICNTSTQSRYFKGLLIRRNGVAFRWIEEPYTVIQNFNALTFRELIPNAEQIRIELSGTQWTTIEGFRDSVQCPCSGGGSVTLIPGPGIAIYGDTIAVIPQQIDTFDIVGGDTLRISLDRDSVPFHFVVLPSGVDTSGYNYSFGIVGDSLCVTDGAGTFCVDVSQFLDNTDTSGFNTALYISGDTLYIQDDNSTKAVSLAPYINTDNQNLSYAPSTGIMSISGGTGDTINVMVGATAGTNGERGLVPRPVAGEQGAFLRGDGTWANPSVGGDNWGGQVVQVQPRLTGDGTGSNPLDIAQQGATSGQALKWNGTSWSPANDLDTSGYNLSFSISGDTLYIQDGASTKLVNLLPYKDNTDAQTLSIDSVTTSDGRRFALSISNGNTIYFEDRDNQQIDTFSISGQVVSLSVQRDGQPAKTIILPTPDGSETIVTGANGVQVTGNGTSGTPYVVAPPTGSDTQTLRYSGTTLTANSALTNNGAQIGINNAPDASYRLKVKQSTDTDGIAVVRSSSTSQISLYHNANGILKTNANNMFFESAGVIALYPAGGGFISQVSINSQSPITVASGNSGLLRLDATYAPTAAGGDFGFLKIYPDVNQTSAADQTLFGIDFNPNLISLKGQLMGFRYWPSVGRYLYQPNGDTVSSHFRGRLGIGLGTTDPVRRLHVVGDMRLTGSIGTPTAVMGRDADGDVANLALRGLSIVTGILTATDTSTTNEIQRLDTFEIVSNTLRASLLNDAVPFSSVDLSPYLDNTDNQVVDTFDIVANTLRLSIESDGHPFKSVSLAPYLDNTDAQTLSIDSTTITDGRRFALSISNGNTIYFEDRDNQQIDTFSISGQVVSLSVQRDGQPAKTIILPTPDGSETIVTAGTGIGVSGNGTSGTPYIISNTGDLSNTNEIQRLDTFEIVANILRASLLNDAVPFSSVNLAPYLDNTDDQVVDTFQIVSNVLRLSLESDGQPFKSVDLSPYVNVGTDLSYSGASSPFNLNSSTGNGVTVTAGAGISLAATSGNLTVTNTDPDQNAANEGVLGVGAGGANTATLLSNTTGQTPVTVSGATGIGVSESTASNGGTITVAPANDLAALEALALTGFPTRIASESWIQRTITAGTGISVADGSGVAGNPTITNTGDLSSTNELQTLNNTGDATSHTATLSGSGGSLKLKEGTNVTLTTDVTGLNGEVTISASVPTGLNGIYGDGTAGSGNDTLPPGGSIVTIPGQNQPLQFNIRPQLPHTNPYTGIEVNTNYSNDDAVVRYFAGTAPSDSIEIYNFDNQSWIKQTGGFLNIESDQNITLTADSVSATAPTRTIAPFIIGQSSDGYFRKIAGASSGQIMKWNGTNWALAADDTGSGGLTGAENGLSVSGSNARLGGTLLTTTTIAQAGFDLRSNNGKWSHSTNTLFGFTPTQGFGVTGSEGNPTTNSSPTLDGIAEFRAHLSNSEQPNSLTIGAYATDNQGMWMQARSQAVPNFSYPLQLNPRGGPVSIGRGTTIPTARFTVTATGATGSTASGMVGLFENTAGSGNVSVGFGTGSDVIGGQLMWNATSDAMRITNRNATNGTSSVRIAIGGETSDVATFEKSAATSLVQFGVGTTTPHSTVQSAGSLATAYLETVGAPTFDETKRTVVYTANANITWTLPTAAACACEGREYILHHSGTAGTLTLSQNVSRGNGGTFNTLTAGQWAYVIYGSSSIRGYKLTSL